VAGAALGAAAIISSRAESKAEANGAEANRAGDLDGIDGQIYSALINKKVNACPMAIRIAWHAAGTYDATDGGTGGSNGATMRFEPEHSDPANAGLFIIHDLLLHVKRLFGSSLSFADLWTLAGCKAVEFMGGPRIPFHFGRIDAVDASSNVPRNGLLPDASQGAAHLRDVFYRMGFSDRDIVALSGAHTVGRCHKVRSGYDGAWTRKPLQFDNEYFKNLMTLEWKVRDWSGPLQFTDVETETLVMLPTDMALKTDPVFRPIAQEYADDQAAFFRDFSSAFGRLVANGCPLSCAPSQATPCPKAKAAAEFRELSMHGSLEHMKRLMDRQGGSGSIDVDLGDVDSGRTAMHKAAFWGHAHVISYLSEGCLAKVSVVDFAGDTPLHDAARFGHVDIVRLLLDCGANVSGVNHKGQTALDLATLHGKEECVALLTKHMHAELTAAAKVRRESFLLGGATIPLAKQTQF